MGLFHLSEPNELCTSIFPHTPHCTPYEKIIGKIPDHRTGNSRVFFDDTQYLDWQGSNSTNCFPITTQAQALYLNAPRNRCVVQHLLSAKIENSI